MSFGTYVIFAGLIVVAIGITSAAIQGANAQSWSYFLIVIGVLLFIIGILLLINSPSTPATNKSLSTLDTNTLTKVAKASI